MATTNNYPPPTPPHHFQQQYQQPQQVQQVQPQYQPQQQQQQQPQYKTHFQTQYQPGAPQPTAQQKPRPQSRKSRSLSFRSDKSHGSNGNNTHKDNKGGLHETSVEKEANRLHTKADPTLAMNEAEPAEVAATGKTSLAPLRNMQHRDSFGNPIAEPDRSNPTRSRWERPLDTIRSFEAAIDGGYSNRRSFLRAEPDRESVSYNNRRSSYYGNNGPGGRFSNESYYNSRPPSMMYSGRQDGSQHDLRQGGMGPRDNFQDQQGYNGGYNQNGGRRGFPRTNSEGQFSQAHRPQGANEYALPSNHRSYETVASASGSGSSAEVAGYQTDPTSSDNSSVERMQAAPKRQQEPLNDYGIGFSQPAEYQPSTFTLGVKNSGGLNGAGGGDMAGYLQAGGAMNHGGPPPPPPKQASGEPQIMRKPTAPNQYAQPAQQRPAAAEKRKSWFARRFSKHD
ncbi:hypothetical protein B0H66DRAFT_4958 [Apodospora peruviana]|uniref:Uncharacterized protein n=1 Tax=Apodospora peruviana TaxID=516989 RepID=A0AAE0MDY1_9PEZI|nr:hypothetical protein B0H66DRAFT_4958 [Apodospora peruviana]